LLGLSSVATEAAAPPPTEAAASAEQTQPRPKPALFARLEQKVAAPKKESLDLWHLVQARKGAQPGQMWQTLQARVTARQQERLFGAVSGLLACLAADAPLLLLFENAQWMDPASQALIDYLGEQVPGLPIWLLLVRRDSDGSGGADFRAGEALRLGPLSREETAALASHLLDSVPVEENLAKAIHEQSGGNPLFVEEIARWLQRSGQAGLHDLQQGLGASGTVQGMILSHLDSLPLSQRDTLRSASVVGTEFCYGEVRVLRPAGPGDETLAGELSALEWERLVLMTDKGADPQYAFRQTLVREVGYHSQSVERRRELHSRLAAYLEERHASELASCAELLALHHELAGSAQPAARYLLLAGRKARQCYAYPQATGFYERALSVLDSIPADERDDEIHTLIARAHEGRGDVALLTGAFPEATTAYEAALTRLPATLPANLQVKLALVLPTQGRAAEAQDHARWAWAASDAKDALTCAATLAWLLWRVDNAQASEWIERGRALAGEERTARTATISALLMDLAGDWPAAQRAYLALDRPVGAALAACRQGDRVLQRGDFAGALALYEQAAGVWERENDSCGLALARYRQAEAHFQSGEAGVARSVLAEAQHLAETAEALMQEDRRAIRRAIEAVDAQQPKPWPPWRWQRYDDEFRILELFQP
jgi:predicted ATPase